MNKKTILLIAFKNNFLCNKKNIEFIDENIGSISKTNVIKLIYYFKNKIKYLDSKYLGFLFPASILSQVLIHATWLAKKTPVMINPFHPSDFIIQNLKQLKVSHILTSKRILEKFNLKFNKFDILYIEQFRKNISLKDKIITFWDTFHKKIPNINENDYATILFTSGTESKPKIVGLTYKNIYENIKWILSLFPIKENFIVLNSLPPFHSFWFTVTGILPFITNTKTIYISNPADYNTISDYIYKYKVNVFITTPSFLKWLTKIEKNIFWEKLEYIIVGSEKMPLGLIEKINKLNPKIKIIEWYWLTECGPVVSLNPPENIKIWTVWKVLPNLDCKIIDLKDHSKIKEVWQPWIITVHWNSVFNWYLNDTKEKIFININSKKYFITNDIGYLDKDWYLTIIGRTKRFIKIWGEMISLPMLEKYVYQYLKKYQKEKQDIDFTIEAFNVNNKTNLILISNKPIDIQQLNRFLIENWLKSIYKICCNEILQEFPLLPSGKIDYKKLKEIIKQKFKNNQITHSSKEIYDLIKLKIAQLTNISPKNITLNSIFGKDIYIDSIDIGELLIFVKNKFNLNIEFEDITSKNIQTVWDLVNLIKDLKNDYKN